MEVSIFYKTWYIKQLPARFRGEIACMLKEKFGYVPKKAMAGRLCDLEDTLGIIWLRG